MRRTIFLALAMCLMAVLSVSADNIRGCVVDAETMEPLPGVEVKLSVKYNTGFYMESKIKTDSAGVFYSRIIFDWKRAMPSIDIGDNPTSATVKMDFNYFGYYPAVKSQMVFDGRDTVNVGNVLLKPSDVILTNVTVNGRMPRFTMNGDTVVFNPEAFHIDEGARLREMLEKLPGVSITEQGQIMWNGKPIKLRMNGHSTYGDGAVLTELPIEAVQSVKQYEKSSELAERTGKDDGDGEQVLDITIKKGFMDRFYGDAEVSKATNDFFLGSLRMNRLSDNDPLLFAIRAGRNNICYSDTYYGGWSTPDVRQQIGMINYQHQWDSPYKDAKRRNSYSLQSSLNHYDEMKDDWSITRTANPNDTLYSQYRGDEYNHHVGLPLKFTHFLNLSNSTTVETTARVQYGRTLNTTNKQTSLYDSNPNELDLAPVNTSVRSRLTDNKTVEADASSELKHYIKDGSIGGYIWLNYNRTDSWQDDDNAITYRDASLGKVHDLQQGDNVKDNISAKIGASNSQWLGSSFMVEGDYHARYIRRYETTDFLRGDGAVMNSDLTNNFRHDLRQFSNILGLRLTQNVGSMVFTEKADIDYSQQWLDYRRGTVLNTSETRSFVEPNIEARLKWKLTKKSMLMLSSAWNCSMPEFLSTLPYYDNTDSLYVREGNPSLRPTSSLRGGMTYSLNIPRGEQSVSIEMNASKDYDPLITMLRYDSSSGAYHSKLINGQHGYSADAKIQYNRSLGGSFYLETVLSAAHSTSYSYEVIRDGIDTHNFLRRRYSRFRIKPTISFNDTKWDISWNSTVMHTLDLYTDNSCVSSRLWDYSSHLKCKYKARQWTFAIYPYIEGSSGYISSEMNSPRFLLSGSVKYAFAKNCCTLKLYADDIFNKDQWIHSSISGNEFTERGEKYIHHYLELTLEYKLEKRKE